MATEIAQLTALIPPPTSVRRRDWAAAEENLQTTLPDDYKTLVDTYGDGLFFDTIRLWTPGEGEHTISTAGPGEVNGFLTMIRQDLADDPEPDLARLPDGGLHTVDLGDPNAAPPYLSWGIGSDGDVGFWHRIGDDPNRWPILYGQVQAWDYHPDGLLHYLIGIVTGTISSNCFPEAQAHAFTSLEN
jgi:hypothetical protein